MRVSFGNPDIKKLTRSNTLIDMHFHSRYSHDCATKVKDIIARAEKLDVYVALTDHNSIKGVLAAKKQGSDRIKPGVEITSQEGKDILVYFYNVDDLEKFFTTHIQPKLQNRSSLSMRTNDSKIRMKDLLPLLSRENCVVSLAHPFATGIRRSYRYFKRNNHLFSYVHGIDAVNQAVPHKRNLQAIGWAGQWNKCLIGGSDGHILKMLGTAFTISKAKTWAGVLDSIKKNRVDVVGQEQKLRHQVINMSRILKEKAKVMQKR